MPDCSGRGRAEPVAVGPPRHAMSRAARNRAHQSRRRRRISAGLTFGVLVVVVVATVFLGSKLWHTLTGPVTDYRGDGKADLVIEVRAGDSTTKIAETLHQHGVVATIKAFLDAAQDNDKISAIQPGFYKTRIEIPAASAVERLAEPENRVGRLVIPEGRQLDDTTDMRTNTVTEGIFTLMSHATCVELDGDRRCVNADALRAAAAIDPVEALSVPAWATERVMAMGTDHRRIEGLIAPGTWNVNPAAPAQTTLSALIGRSAGIYAESGLQDTAASLEMAPYDVLVVASLLQGEAKPDDFSKVARVIYNRLSEYPTLEFDSTVNYPLDRREVATTDADRAQRTPWNTYVLRGLPATPICSPGAEALGGAERPADGDWLYFVTVDGEGTTLFTSNYQQHLANSELARRNGILDSTR